MNILILQVLYFIFLFSYITVTELQIETPTATTPIDKLRNQVETIAVQSASAIMSKELSQLKEDFEKQMKIHEEQVVQKVSKLVDSMKHRRT
jgi:hypothetical protein